MTNSPALKFLVRRRTTFTWLVPLALLAATYEWGHWDPVAFAAGVACLILGEMIRFWAAGYIHKDDVIATTGPYALVRNPLYLGSLLLCFGYLVISGLGPIAWFVVIAFFLLFHLAAIVSEEQFLILKFGAPYQAYLKQVPRLIPYPRIGARAPAEEETQIGRFSPKQAISNREHITAAVTFATAVIFAAVELLRSGRGGL